MPIAPLPTRWVTGSRTTPSLMQVCEMLEIEHDLEGESIGFERASNGFGSKAELEQAGD